MGIGKALKSAVDYICDHSGTICAGVAVAGVGATAYFSGKAAVRVDHELDCDMTRMERIKLYARCYWKTAVAGALTVGAIIGSDRLHVGKEVGLATGLAVWKGKYMKLDKKLGEVAGDDIRDEVHREIVKDEMSEMTITDDEKKYGDKKIIFYEPFTKQYIESTYAQYLEAMLETNFRFQRDMNVSLSTPIDYLGGVINVTSDNLIWDIDDEMQQYNCFGNEGCIIRLCDSCEKDLEYWLHSKEEQNKENAVTLLFNIDPNDVRLMYFNKKTGTLQYKEELPWE